jgi:hypothetical protein
MDDTKFREIEKNLRKWLSNKYAPYCAVLSTQRVKDFLKDNASLSAAELLRPFSFIEKLDNKYIQIVEKAAPFKMTEFRLKMIDVGKIDGQVYKNSEYKDLYKYIMNIECP